MAIILGGLTLPRTTIWSDRELDADIAQERRYTLGGKQIVSYATLPKGRPITLEGQIHTGWITKQDYDALLALSKVPGATYVLSYEGTDYDVMFMHDEPPAVEGVPLVYRNNQADTDYYTYKAKLFTV